MKRRIVSILTALALCLSLWPGTALAAGGTLSELKLDEKKSDVTESTYTWQPVLKDSTDPYSDIISGTLTLAEGFNATKVIIPDAAVTIVTQGDCTIGTLTTPNYPNNTELTFSGDGTHTLTIQERLNLSGGNGNSLTIDAGASVIAEKGIEGGASGVDFPITVNGNLTSIHDNSSGSAAIYAGKVTIGGNGVLEVSGDCGVMLNGMDGTSGRDFSNVFTVTEDGRFTSNCSSYNIQVVATTADNYPKDSNGNVDVSQVIVLGDEYMPENCEVNLYNTTIMLWDTKEGKEFTGPLTIHKKHKWSTDWAKDKNTHWHPCKFDGCDKKQEGSEAAHTFNDITGVCECGAQLTVTLDNTYNLVYDGNQKTPGVTAVTIDGTTLADTDYTVSYGENIDAGPGTVTVTGTSTPAWTVEETFTIEPAELTLTPLASDIEYGQRLSDITPGGTAKDPQNNDVPGTWSWFAPDTQPTASGSFPVVFTPDDAKNYKTPETNPTTNVTVKPVTPTLTLTVNPSSQVAGGEVAVSCTVVNPHDSNLTDVPNAKLTYKIGTETTEQPITDGKFTIPEGTAKDTIITVTASTAVTGKYNAATETATVTVTDKTPVTITGVTAQDGTYNGSQHTGYTGTPTAAPYAGSFTVDYIGRNSTNYSSTTAPTNAGDYTVTISLADTSTYTGSLLLNFTIKQATITIKADNKQATVGSARPDLTYTVSGLVKPPDTLATEPTLTCNADMSKAGSYPITASGAAAPGGGNYDSKINYVPGTLTVTEPYVPPVHRHNWSTAWAFDSARHWHRCLNGCSQRNSLAEHVYDDEWDTDCNVCGYVREVTPPEPEHTHVWAEEWSRDEARHWHECTAPGCDITDNSQKDGYAEHVYDDEQDTDCNICGYVREVTPPEPEHTHVWSEEWSHDEARHWHECTAPGCDITADSEKDGYGAHVPGAWTTGDPATSTTAGRRYRACAVCGRILETESIPAAGGSSGGGSSVRTYAITVEKPEHGKVTSNRTRAASGTTVTLTVTPDTGYVLLDLTVTDSQGNPVTLTDRNTFTMPSRAVTVRASFAPLPDDSREKPCDSGADCPSRAYADLDTGAWYHEAVDYAIRKGLLTGYGDGTFDPSGILSRAQLAQILYNMEGKPGINGGGGFMDVAPDSWYADAVMWAAAQGIAGGYGNGKFGPNDHITREQLAVMLWRYSKGPSAAGKELHFSDANRASSWALDALRWAAENGILNGKGNGMLDPRGLTSRAETAQMLKNFAENSEENK